MSGEAEAPSSRLIISRKRRLQSDTPATIDATPQPLPPDPQADPLQI